MAFDDFKLGRLFPTREGVAIGTGPERVMLEATDGADNIKKRFQNNPDGSVTMLQTRNGWPVFTTIPGIPVVAVQCSIEMDSGIVDMIDLTPASPGLLASGLVYQTNYVSSYVAAKTTSIGSGKLIDPNLEGTVVGDGAVAKAYADTFLTATAYTDRKIISAKIPSSLFTGRMRLYVQSLYGGNLPALVLSDPSGGAGRPVLGINTSAREFASLPAVNIGSGSGLFFDATTMRHYLIQLTTDTAYITPLVGTTCAEKYRTTLLAAGLSADDQERIESYILSQSFPDTAATQIVSFTSTPNEAFGYSWHFNWDGDKCDIVDVQEVYIPSDSCYGFTTTHYRLTFSQTAGVFFVARSIVSGPSTWSVPKHTNVIAYPDWLSKALIKAGNTPSVILSGSRSGRVYCFYKKNDLQVVSVNTNLYGTSDTRVSSPAHFGGTYYPSVTGFLIEEEDGETVAKHNNGGTSCFFSAEGQTVGGYSDTSTKTTETWTWWQRMTVTEATGAGYNEDNVNGSLLVGQTITFKDGTPNAAYTVDGVGRIVPGVVTWPDSETITGANPGINFYSANRFFYYTFWEVEASSLSESRSSKTLTVIPFLDAEAAYLSDQNLTTESGTKTTGRKTGVHIWGETDVSVIYSGTPGYVHYGHYNPLDTTNSGGLYEYAAGVPGPYSSSVTTGDKKLVSSNGVFPVATMPSEGTFYSTASSVAQLYPTYSSANGAVKAPDNGVASGSATFPTISTFVGWA